MKFYENPFSEGRVVPCGHMYGRTDRELIVAFCNFTKVHKTQTCAHNCMYNKQYLCINVALLLPHPLMTVGKCQPSLTCMQKYSYHLLSILQLHIDCYNRPTSDSRCRTTQNIAGCMASSNYFQLLGFLKLINDTDVSHQYGTRWVSSIRRT